MANVRLRDIPGRLLMTTLRASQPTVLLAGAAAPFGRCIIDDLSSGAAAEASYWPGHATLAQIRVQLTRDPYTLRLDASITDEGCETDEDVHIGPFSHAV